MQMIPIEAYLVSGDLITLSRSVIPIFSDYPGIRIHPPAGSEIFRDTGYPRPDVIVRLVDVEEPESPPDNLSEGERTSADVPYLFILQHPDQFTNLAEEGKSGSLPTGFILLENCDELLIPAVEAVVAGLWVIDPVLGDLSEESRKGENEFIHGIEASLTDQEQRVLQLVADGLANKEIAVVLGITERTVKFHVASLMKKLNVLSRTEAAVTAIRRGLLSI